MTALAPARIEAGSTKIGRDAKRRHGSGGFRIEILFPGQALGRGDSGIGTIGRIDDAQVAPGTLVAMHPHRDDEILTYVRGGRVEHSDTVGDVEVISATRLMLMGAGSAFQHKELVLPDSDPMRGLQIFLRPKAEGLTPQVLFHDFGEVLSEGTWRLVAGPEAGAPLRVRSRSWVHDVRLGTGGRLALPPAPIPGATRLLYVFEGAATIKGMRLTAGESVILGSGEILVEAGETTDLVLFTTDEAAPVFKGGMFSGNQDRGR